MKFFRLQRRLTILFHSLAVFIIYKRNTFGKKPKTSGGSADLDQYIENWENVELDLIQKARQKLQETPPDKQQTRELISRMRADADTIRSQFTEAPRAISGRLLHYEVQLRRLAKKLEQNVTPS